MEWFFLESFRGHMLSKNKVQWLDLTSRLCSLLLKLLLAKSICVHYDCMVKYLKHCLSSSSKNYSSSKFLQHRHVWHAHNHGCHILMVASHTKIQRFSFLHPKNTIKIETSLDYNTSWNFRNTNIVNSFKLVHVWQSH